MSSENMSGDETFMVSVTSSYVWIQARTSNAMECSRDTNN